LFLAANGTTTGAPGFQIAVGRWLTDAFEGVLRWLEPVPEPILGLGLLGLAAVFFVAAVRGRRGAPAVSGSLEGSHDHQSHEEEASPSSDDRERAGTASCH
ncbi:MAG TPA: hypothetical protein VFT27_00195, partial [Actinomycetota bacterium]|nr:hypothetical protein [Actinomycetota bacterium]